MKGNDFQRAKDKLEDHHIRMIDGGRKSEDSREKQNGSLITLAEYLKLHQPAVAWMLGVR